MTIAAHDPDRRPRAVSEALAPHLPLLRRYARALAGSQSRGDGYVAATLEAILADRGVLDLSAGPRVGLYAAFHHVWRAAGGDGEPTSPGAPADPRERAAGRRLQRLTARPRQALLLTALEGFSTPEAAAIMGESVDEAAALIEEAVAELRRQTAARVLIIEDEPIIAMDVETIVTDLGHDVVGVADTRTRAVEIAQRERPDLVLADVQLADGSSGIEAAWEILGMFDVPVIFITAYPERLLTGTRPEPTFLISKPFRNATVEATISQALFFRESIPAA